MQSPKITSLLRFCLIGTLTLLLGACVTMDDVSESYQTVKASVKEQVARIDIPTITPGHPDDGSSDSDDAEQRTAGGDAPLTAHKPASSSAESLTVTAVDIGANTAMPCPPIEAIADLSQLKQFSADDNPVPEGLISQITIGPITSHCEANEKNLIVDIEIVFDGQLGPRGRQMNQDRKADFIYPYFLALTAPNDAIIAKEVFAVPLSYEVGQYQTTHVENIHQIIPTGGVLYNEKTKLMIGFQLSPAQLGYNRAAQSNVIHITPTGVTTTPAATPAPQTIMPADLGAPEKPAIADAARPPLSLVRQSKPPVPPESELKTIPTPVAVPDNIPGLTPTMPKTPLDPVSPVTETEATDETAPIPSSDTTETPETAPPLAPAPVIDITAPL